MSLPTPELRVISGGSASEPTELELLRAFCAGDMAAFGALVHRHQETVFKVVRRYSASTEDARDLVQKAFLAAFEAAQRTAPKLIASEVPVPFKAWLLRIAVNLGKNNVRDSSRWTMAPVEAVDREQNESPRATELLERKEQEVLTRRAVLALPPRQREVFTLRIDAGLSFGEIAETLEISEGNAKAHFHYAVKRLKEEVAKLGGLS